MITAEYLPPILTLKADWESRNVKKKSERKFLPVTLQKMRKLLDKLKTDLLTSRIGHQLPPQQLLLEQLHLKGFSNYASNLMSRLGKKGRFRIMN